MAAEVVNVERQQVCDAMRSHDGHEACVVNPPTLYLVRPYNLEPMREDLRPVDQDRKLIQEPGNFFVDQLHAPAQTINVVRSSGYRPKLNQDLRRKNEIFSTRS
jgi:hypothetical protein